MIIMPVNTSKMLRENYDFMYSLVILSVQVCLHFYQTLPAIKKCIIVIINSRIAYNYLETSPLPECLKKNLNLLINEICFIVAMIRINASKK